jgi:plastocyanin
MKKIITTFACLILFTQGLLATTYTITISGFAYSPTTLSVAVGDVVTIAASGTHPLVQVDQTNWNTNTPTPVSGGWGTKTAAYTFTVTSTSTIYYGCQNHMASMQMKGQITVTTTGIKQVTATANKSLLYPNPVVNGEFTVKTENSTSNGKVTIYNIEGKLLETYTLTNGVVEIKTKLPTGEYFYSVTINQKEISREKFLITNK